MQEGALPIGISMADLALAGRPARDLALAGPAQVAEIVKTMLVPVPCTTFRRAGRSSPKRDLNG